MEQYLFPIALTAIIFAIISFVQWRIAERKIEQIQSDQWKIATDFLTANDEVKTALANLHTKVAQNHKTEMAELHDTVDEIEQFAKFAETISKKVTEIEAETKNQPIRDEKGRYKKRHSAETQSDVPPIIAAHHPTQDVIGNFHD